MISHATGFWPGEFRVLFWSFGPKALNQNSKLEICFGAFQAQAPDHNSTFEFWPDTPKRNSNFYMTFL